MDPITWLILVGGGLYALGKKSKSYINPLPPVDKSIKGFELTPDCKNIIIYNENKAIKWAYNFAKDSDYTKDEKLQLLLGQCKFENLNPTIKNYLFVYKLFISMINYFLNENSFEKLTLENKIDIFVSLNKTYSYIKLILENEDIELDNKFKKPLDINKNLTNLIKSIRGYDINNCVFSISDDLKMISFARKISSKLMHSDVEVNYNTFENIIFDDCEFLDKIDYEDEYLLSREFFQGQVDIKNLSIIEANSMLNDIIEEYENEGLDVENFQLLKPNI